MYDVEKQIFMKTITALILNFLRIYFFHYIQSIVGLAP